MATTRSKSTGKALRTSLDRLAKRALSTQALRSGDIVFHLSGAGGGDFCLSCEPKKHVKVEDVAAVQARAPLIEISGSAAVIKAIVDGREDGRKRFLAGGIRIRGDLRYFSDMALELGIIDRPL